MAFEVSLTPTASRMLANISDRRIQGELAERAKRLAEEPEKQGGALAGELAGLRSVRAVGQRCRIIYRVRQAQAGVQLLSRGHRKKGTRKDIYRLRRRLAGAGSL